MPDTRIAAIVALVRVRMRARALLFALAAGGATATAINLVALAAAPRPVRLTVSGVAGIIMAAWMLRRTWRITAASAAQLIEDNASLDNLLVTAIELRERPRPVSSALRQEIARQADARLTQVDVSRVTPLGQPVMVMLAVMAGFAATLSIEPGVPFLSPASVGQGLEARTHGIDGFTVEIVSPAYSGRPPETVASPVQITMVGGSRVKLAVASSAEGVVAEFAGQPPLTFAREGGRFVGEWLADRSTAVAIRPAGGAGREAKFLSVIVVPDAPPQVRVPTPGTDLAITGTKGRITIEVDSQDDLGLASLSVRFTKASGGGEALTFTEGEVPLVMSRVTDRHWRGRADWVLDGLALADGDVLVYRAIARDRNPNGRPVQSEQYLVEVGRLAGAVGSGFALPAEEKKYAISQQMVIYKTEQLIAAFKGKSLPSRSLGVESLPSRSLGEGWLEQNQLLGIEQRMVRAEVVFLGGGEVQDEVEEAAHSHEVAEGRLENTGRAEMLRAINFMSRAETELNAGRAVEALVLEREALKALERAFDRRRYFLRTLPERSRIDATRRLTGDLKDARSWTRDRAALDGPGGIISQRALMRDLAAAANTATGADAALAARVAALDPADPSLQQAAVTLATATTNQAGRAAVWSAMQAVTSHALKSLGSAARLRLAIDPLAGRLADELASAGKGSR